MIQHYKGALPEFAWVEGFLCSLEQEKEIVMCALRPLTFLGVAVTFLDRAEGRRSLQHTSTEVQNTKPHSVANKQQWE